MKKFLVCVLSVFLLVGCGQLLDNTSDESVNMPDIVFMERVYNDNDGFISIAFTDSNGDCYTSVDKEVCSSDFAELIEEYKSGGLDGRITKSGSRNPEELRSNYKKLCETVRQNDCNIVYPMEFPDVETESYSWFGLYYDENGDLKSQIIHANKCMTSLCSDSDAINEIYKWYTDSYVADSTVSASENMPDIVFLERVYRNQDGFIKIAFSDSNGDYYTSVDKEVCSSGFAELVDKYKSGGLDGRITKSGSRNPEELQSNYKKLCEAVSQNDCDIVYPDSLPDVVADSYSWYGLYYDKNGEFKAQVIHENECETGLYSDSDAINEIYKWYTDSYVADSTVSISENMPDIVFMNTIDYNDNSNGHALTFYDKDGNYYTSDDEYVCTLSYKEMINEYKAGNINDKITFHTSCDVNELYDNYKKLCNAVQSGDCSIVYPEIMPCVEDSIYRWYGIYYDKNGELEITVIHKRECMTELESDNETVNEIYKWYIDNYVDE